MAGIFLYCFSPYFLRQGPSLNLELAILATLAVPGASRIWLCVHLMLEDTGICCHMLLYLVFPRSGDLNSDPHVFEAHTLPTKPSLQLTFLF